MTTQQNPLYEEIIAEFREKFEYFTDDHLGKGDMKELEQFLLESLKKSDQKMLERAKKYIPEIRVIETKKGMGFILSYRVGEENVSTMLIHPELSDQSALVIVMKVVEAANRAYEEHLQALANNN